MDVEGLDGWTSGVFRSLWGGCTEVAETAFDVLEVGDVAGRRRDQLEVVAHLRVLSSSTWSRAQNDSAAALTLR